MKKIRKIVALALATVMMMAMSVTAFAKNASDIKVTKDNSTIKVTQISSRDETTNVSIYPLALVDTETNTVEVLSWAEALYPVDKTTDPYTTLLDNFDASNLTKALDSAINAGTVSKAADDQVSAKGADVTFSVPAGVYVIRATGGKVIYSTMVAKAYEFDANGTYTVAKDEVKVVAKGTTNTVEKEENDSLVNAGQEVNFTITSTVPYNKTEYKVFDNAKNLTAPTKVKVTVGGVEKSFSFDEGVANETTGYTKYTMDLSDLVKDAKGAIDTYVGQTVVITYTASVVGVEGFINQAWDSTYDVDDNGEPKNPPTTYGYSADITLIKTNNANEKLAGAEFTVSLGDSTLKFKLNTETNTYELSTAADASETIVTDDNGEVKIAGLKEGKYHFTETKAPKGYAINPDGLDVTVKDMSDELKTVAENQLTADQKSELHRKGDDTTLVDSTLAQLPFTGGMGTTIFTVLGVAIMAMASALYFATKKKATK
ncbi:LPXTG-motif cell wall anchor domain-containing protein/fimbrial isopeptide formation D2 domain-containing protein [Pseudobutyrivibrio ruminis]|uniref:LPXTG-motif cell wall anchor domain-containing protein/fimbrial isopeptide formation D2 domain-containing protein n=1 Tax=Pseudobutyrivibrio ruminis TaxID=46206 RepID=A0A1H7FB06_9FIRM|nr:SpaA isopeptide-forming pilin-related protein [Pseudobutyrivibrio ruminis]SEK22884.1 LPXTG-motif cell wall anchor domain-containing protein/fimbrial isopeptide formation D2 domain-containing protein [Pseudobutyrivibrio ruminis]